MENMIQKKQAQIEILLKDALDIQQQVEDISAMAEQVSEKFAEIGSNIQNSSKIVGKFAKSISKKSKYKNMSKDIGDITELGVNLLGKGVSKAGDWWADRKERKMLETLLPKKQELAKEKISAIQRIIPKIEKDKERVINFIKSEVILQIDFDETDRFDMLMDSSRQIFEAYYIFEQSDVMCKFLFEEFNAWLKGEHFSNYMMPEQDDIVYSCINNLASWSKFDRLEIDYKLPNNINIGNYLLLLDDDISEFTYENPELVDLMKKASKKAIRTKFSLSNNSKERYNRFFNQVLLKNDKVKVIHKKIKRKYIWYSVITISFLILILSLL